MTLITRPFDPASQENIVLVKEIFTPSAPGEADRENEEIVIGRINANYCIQLLMRSNKPMLCEEFQHINMYSITPSLIPMIFLLVQGGVFTVEEIALNKYQYTLSEGLLAVIKERLLDMIK